MKERLQEFLRSENKSSAQLAEEIGVQPSGISHILSGRNNPSLDFVLKMLERYQFLSTDWLLFGKGSMYREIIMQSLFDDARTIDRNVDSHSADKVKDEAREENGKADHEIPEREMHAEGSTAKRTASKVVMFYNDGSFKEYVPQE
jgi:transcriptional regulator with XRE-family HTH domain